jgi:glyoxylase-like metal-dependent hydrolase (beta-lactamase superfamily II)
MSSKLIRISDHLYVHHGAINVGILCDNDKALLIDFGEGSVFSSLDELGIKAVDTVFFTHHHRDQASGFSMLTDKVIVGVPEQEHKWFTEV